VRTIKNNFLYIVFLLAFGLIGGYFTTLYSIETMPEESLNEAIAQVGSLDAVILITALQTALIYSLLLGSIGKFLAEKIGTWRDFSFEAKPLVSVILVSLIGGAVMIFADRYGFGSFNQQIADGYLAKPTLNYFLSSIFYGGVIEEVMIRLFVMSLLAFIFMKISKNDEANDASLILANVISALLFAACHLPAIAQTLGLDALIIARCFIMNGAYGIIFGRLYRKYGIGYAMLAHAGVHIVSKAIWLLI
jgi:membrane protease YdiL (CAAX protease family)